MERQIENEGYIPGTPVHSIFVIRKVELQEYDHKKCILFQLGSKNGRIYARYWGEDCEVLFNKITPGKVLKIDGIVVDHKGQIFLKIERLRLAKDEEVKIEHLLPTGRFSIKSLCKRMTQVINSISNQHLTLLLSKIFVEDKNFIDLFSCAPAGKLWHGAYIGGLIEHTLRVAKICEVASSFYPSCRRDLIVAGALLHDIGKVDELSAELGFFDYTVSGRLISHVILGFERVRRVIGAIPDFPENLAIEILHIILSHHGKGELGSPVSPQTLEAEIVHHSDMLDSRASGIERIIEKNLNPSQGHFSEYVNLLGRYIYLDGYRSDSSD